MMYLLHRKKIDIYANISLFVSYSEVTAFTRSDGGSAPRDDLYSPERQWRPGHLDEPQRQIPSEDPVTRQPSGQDLGNQMSPPIWLCSSWNWTAVSSGQRRNGPPTEPGFSQGFFSPFCHQWSFGSLPLSPLACLVGDT